EDTDTEDFTKPDSVVEVDVQKGSNPPSLASENAPSDSIVTELFVKGTEPDKVSEEYEELDAVSDLKAEYKEDDNEIDISWYYDDADVSFEVSYQTDDGDMKELTTTEDKDTSLSSVEEGKKYTIQVIAVSNESDTKSDAATTTVDLSAEEDDDNNDDNNDNNN